MEDFTFYKALSLCYRPNEEQPPRCKQCPLFAYGYSPNDECRRMLHDEIRHRKCVALANEEKR